MGKSLMHVLVLQAWVWESNAWCSAVRERNYLRFNCMVRCDRAILGEVGEGILLLGMVRQRKVLFLID
jgi:hypothetical protein